MLDRMFRWNHDTYPGSLAIARVLAGAMEANKCRHYSASIPLRLLPKIPLSLDRSFCGKRLPNKIGHRRATE